MNFRFLIGLLFLVNWGFSQSLEFEKKFNQANVLYYDEYYTNAGKLYEECYKIDSTHIGLLKRLSKLAIRQKKWERVAVLSNKLQRMLPHEGLRYQKKEVYAYFFLQDYQKANLCLKRLQKNIGDDDPESGKYKKLAKDIAFAIHAIENPVPFNPINLGKSINSKEAEYLPSMTQSGRHLIFTRNTARNTSFPSLQEDFFYSKNNHGEWTSSIPLSRRINTVQNEGAPSISADASILYFAACKRRDGKGKCDIYYSFNRGSYWTTPKNLEKINTEYWESQPNISADGKQLFFVSNRPGGFGKKDIWAVDIDNDGKMGEPYNLGKNINTAYDEMSPFLHFDNKSLYFSSDGWPGMGSKDIFISRKLEDNTWQEAKNLGYPINSVKTDNSFFVDASGETAYFSSKRKGGFGKEDIYKFELYRGVRPSRTGYYNALVIDLLSKKKIEAQYEITSLKDSSVTLLKESKRGSISLALEADQDYLISVFAPGYLYYSSTIKSTTEDSLSLIEEKIFLEPIMTNSVFELKNISFNFDKSELKPSSLKELNLFAKYLGLNPKIRISIEGHTDNKGSAEYNLVLSKGRAESVKEYLLNENILSSRIQTKGLGSAQILDKNEKMQHLNRRVVIRIKEHE